jgi:predicted lipoprotein with Yx(FWY)xxD motif
MQILEETMRAVAAVAALALAVIVPTFAIGAASMPTEVKETSGVLTDSKGMTLYTFDNDKNAEKSACNGNCANNWPALKASATDRDMGDWKIITRDDGSKQWTYKGKPLYTYSKDMKAVDKTGDNVGNVWHVAKG